MDFQRPVLLPFHVVMKMRPDGLRKFIRRRFLLPRALRDGGNLRIDTKNPIVLVKDFTQESLELQPNAVISGVAPDGLAHGFTQNPFK